MTSSSTELNELLLSRAMVRVNRQPLHGPDGYS